MRGWPVPRFFCGSLDGYAAHVENDEPVCGPCEEAHSALGRMPVLSMHFCYPLCSACAPPPDGTANVDTGGRL